VQCARRLGEKIRGKVKEGGAVRCGAVAKGSRSRTLGQEAGYPNRKGNSRGQASIPARCWAWFSERGREDRGRGKELLRENDVVAQKGEREEGRKREKKSRTQS